MKTYRVVWEIDIEADSPVEAAKEALSIQRKGPRAPILPDDAVVFLVDGEEIDLAVVGLEAERVEEREPYDDERLDRLEPDSV